MIEPKYLAQLRRTYRTEVVLTMVQLEQLIPGWWANYSDLAEQMGCNAEILSRTMVRLEGGGLIGKSGAAGRSGVWLWWIKRSADEVIDMSLQPCWILYDHTRGKRVRVPKGKEREWAESRGIVYSTFRSLMTGQTKMVNKRWTVVKGPVEPLFDLDAEAEAA